MEFGWSDEEAALRSDVRSLLAARMPDWWGADSRRLLADEDHAEFSFGFVAELAERGWLTPHWPAEHGGRDAPPWQHFIIGEELWSHHEPRGPQYMNVNWIGPAIMRFGTAEQQDQHLRRIAAGDVLWCQGFSEPDAGSDLASLRTSAVRDGDEYVVDGRKIWTSYADVADFCFLLVRTAPHAPARDGITVLLVPMDTPGMEVRHIPALVGDHAFHELLMTGMRVPVSCRLGPENEGWGIVREALAFERVGAPRYGSAARVLDRLAAWASECGRYELPGVRERFGEALAACEAARLLAYKVVDGRARSAPPTADANVARVAMVRAERVVGELAFDLMGPEGLVDGTAGDTQYRNALVSGVAAGTYEVQLDLVARTFLGLPRG